MALHDYIDLGKLTEKSIDEPMKPKKAQGPSHGDELAYIFEPLGPDGQPMGGEVSSTDARVRENFVGLISKFAHGLDDTKTKNNSKILGGILFPSSADQFLKIGESLTIGKDFRFCQIGLWGNMGDRLTGALCKNLLGNLLNLQQLGKLPSIPAQLPGQLAGQMAGQMQGQLPVQLPAQNTMQLVPGLLGKQPTRTPQRQPQRPQRTTQGPFKLPFDF